MVQDGDSRDQVSAPHQQPPQGPGGLDVIGAFGQKTSIEDFRALKIAVAIVDLRLSQEK